MDRQLIRDHLAQAERHVAEGLILIERQKSLAAKLQADGHAEAAASARSLLAQFEEMQAMHIVDRDRLIQELSDV